MKRFAGSVGTADIYYQDALIASANTLTDSTITISTTQDEIRGGMYAPVQFTFTHDASIKVALTDIIWSLDYIKLQLGAVLNHDDQNAYTSEIDTVAVDGSLSTAHLPVAMDFGCSKSICLISYRKEGSSDAWVNVTQDTPALQFVKNGLTSGVKYCVRYAWSNPEALKAEVYSHIVPAEVRLVIRAPLFAGDSCEASNATSAGEVQYVLPRFRFDGNVTINGAMSSNSTMALNGTALASNTGCDMNGGKLMDIIEVTPGTSWTEGVVGIAAGDVPTAGDTADIYFVYEDGGTRKLQSVDIAGGIVTVAPAAAINATTLVYGAVDGTVSLTNITTVAPLVLNLAA